MKVVDESAYYRDMSNANSTTTESTEKSSTELTYERYLGELDSLALFEYAQKSHASRQKSHASRQFFERGNGRMKQLDSRTCNLMKVMGLLTCDSRYRALMPVALGVISKCNPHASLAEWQGKIFEVAKAHLAGGYDDVEMRSGPESFTHKQCQREYTREEKLVMLVALKVCCDDGGSLLGWCATRAAKELGVESTLTRLGAKF